MNCEHSLLEQFTCGDCGKSWCGICVPTPSARCPYEYQHVIEIVRPATPLAPHGGCNWEGCRECFPNGAPKPNYDYDQVVRDLTSDDPERKRAAIEKVRELNASIVESFSVHGDEVKPDPGEAISKADKDSVELIVDGEYLLFRPVADMLSPEEIWEIHNEGFIEEEREIRPCPACGEGGGFHNDEMHRNNIDPKHLKEKGWHNG